jgi:hypothetical protein
VTQRTREVAQGCTKSKRKDQPKGRVEMGEEGQATLMKWHRNSGDREENPDRDKS